MTNQCLNHPERKAFNFCKVCRNYYCEDCLVEGPEYYYCKNEKCQQELKNIINNEEKAAKLFEESKKNNVLYELKKSKIPFYVISLFVATLLGLRHARINELDFAETAFYILGASLGLWGLPFLITILIGTVVTIKKLRPKIFFYIYTAIWIIVITFMTFTLFSPQ